MMTNYVFPQQSENPFVQHVPWQADPVSGANPFSFGTASAEFVSKPPVPGGQSMPCGQQWIEAPSMMKMDVRETNALTTNAVGGMKENNAFTPSAFCAEPHRRGGGHFDDLLGLDFAPAAQPSVPLQLGPRLVETIAGIGKSLFSVGQHTASKLDVDALAVDQRMKLWRERKLRHCKKKSCRSA